MSASLPAIRNTSGEIIDVAFHAGAPDESPVTPERGPRQIVVIGHGVTAHKERPLLIALSEGLALAGIACLRVSFAGNGASGGRFEQATPSKEVQDLGSIVDVLSDWGVTRIGYVGHSMGAAVGVLRAARDARIRCLVSLAGMVHVHAFMRRTCGHLAPGAPMFDKPECPWSQALADDAARIGSVTMQAALVEVPWLLVHGEADELVPIQDALDARAAADGRPELITLPGLDHRFTGAIPQVVDVVVPWLSKHM
jgi:uncharacterized protein